MKISVRNLEPTKVKLTVTVDPEEFNPYLDEARKEIAKQVNVPGFRKGHVPGKIIDQRIGFGAVAGEAVNNGVPELYSKALEEKGIHPMAQPDIDGGLIGGASLNPEDFIAIINAANQG